ncbi:MAG: response regulator [Chloroflexota bacterium]
MKGLPVAERAQILVVDDDPTLVQITRRVLEGAGYQVATAGSGEEALRAVEAGDPDLVLLDVVLPDINGVEVCRRIKAADRSGRPHVILLSGVKTGGDAQALGLESGADGYIARPVANRELLARVEAMLRLRRVEAALEARTRLLEAEIARRKQVEEALRRSEAARIQQERLAAVWQLTAGLAHNFNSLFTTMLLRTELALQQPDLSPKLKETLETVHEESEKAADLVDKLLAFSRKTVMRFVRLDLEELLREQISNLSSSLPAVVEVTVAVQTGKRYEINADAARLEDLIRNLVQNAVDAMRAGGNLRISLERNDADDVCALCQQTFTGEWVQLRFADDGEGIADEALPRIFEPFLSTRVPEREGLGLSQVMGIVKQHNGHLTVSSEVGGGTDVVVYLPVPAA